MNPVTRARAGLIIGLIVQLGLIFFGITFYFSEQYARASCFFLMALLARGGDDS